MPYEHDAYANQQVPITLTEGPPVHPAAGTDAAADDTSVSVGSLNQPAHAFARGAGASSGRAGRANRADVMGLVGQIVHESDNLRVELAKSYALTHAMGHALEEERIRQQARERQRGKAAQEEVDKEVVALLQLVGFGVSGGGGGGGGIVDTSGVGRDGPFDLFSTDEHGFTAMMWAAETGATRICEWLVAKGAGGLVNHPDEDGATPLWYACSGGEETEEVALWLVEHGGADVRSRTCWDTACLTAACRSSTLAVCQSLVAHGAAADLDTGLRAAVCHDRDLICQWLLLLGCPPTVDDFATPRTVEKRLLLDRLVHWAEHELMVWDERVREVRRETKLGQAAGRGLFSSPGLEGARHTHERTLKASLWAAPVVSPIRKRIPTAGRWLGGGGDDARWLGGAGGVGDFTVGDDPGAAGAPSAKRPPAPHQRLSQGPPPQSPSSTHPRGVPRAHPPPALHAQRLGEVQHVQAALAALREIRDVA